mgnify:CR=1 FL=1
MSDASSFRFFNKSHLGDSGNILRRKGKKKNGEWIFFFFLPEMKSFDSSKLTSKTRKSISMERKWSIAKFSNPWRKTQWGVLSFVREDNSCCRVYPKRLSFFYSLFPTLKKTTKNNRDESRYRWIDRSIERIGKRSHVWRKRNCIFPNKPLPIRFFRLRSWNNFRRKRPTDRSRRKWDNRVKSSTSARICRIGRRIEKLRWIFRVTNSLVSWILEPFSRTPNRADEKKKRNDVKVKVGYWSRRHF